MTLRFFSIILFIVLSTRIIVQHLSAVGLRNELPIWCAK